MLVLTGTIKTDSYVAVGGVGSYFGTRKLHFEKGFTYKSDD